MLWDTTAPAAARSTRGRDASDPPPGPDRVIEVSAGLSRHVDTTVATYYRFWAPPPRLQEPRPSHGASPRPPPGTGALLRAGQCILYQTIGRCRRWGVSPVVGEQAIGQDMEALVEVTEDLRKVLLRYENSEGRSVEEETTAGGLDLRGP